MPHVAFAPASCPLLPRRFRLAPTCEWDIAAADIIVREAGGAVLQAGTQDNKGNPLQDWKVGVCNWGRRRGLSGRDPGRGAIDRVGRGKRSMF